MLSFLTFAIVGIVVYAYWREGLMTAFAMLCNVLLAGLVAFQFFEPIATELEPMLDGSFLAGYEDALCLTVLFSLTLGGLRLATNTLAGTEIDYHPLLRQIGTVVSALLMGYLVAGFLICVAQTLPWQQNFLGFQAQVERGEPRGRRLVPPDRVWLALMHRAGLGPFSRSESPTFDADGSFELRYFRLRRYKE
jgi:hypothetical protein